MSTFETVVSLERERLVKYCIFDVKLLLPLQKEYRRFQQSEFRLGSVP